jgi:GT2 family glycosyltransferase
LNPDIYFDKGTLETIYLFMSNNPEFGLLMPKILNINNEIQFLCKTNPTFFDLLLRGFAPKFIKSFFSNRLDEYEYKRYDLNNIIYNVPYLSGCFMFFRTVEFDKVGLFDESFFMYMEDADISRRFSLDSKTVYFPFAKVNHYHNALSHKKMKYRLIAIYSAVLYFNKWGWKFF